MKLGGYVVGDALWEEQTCTVRSGTELATQRRVLIRTPLLSTRAQDTADRLRRDYEIARALPPELVVPPIALERSDAGSVLILADTGARPLQQILALRRVELLEALDIGAGLAMVVGQLHAKRIIHKNLSPHSVWYDQTRGEVRVTDFGFAGRVAEDGYQIPLAGHVEGLLTHIAPEQTGRLIRVVDHRADNYSIGVLLYQLLTGRLPFSSTDPLQLVHAHLARIAPCPHDVDPAIPVPVSGIVMKLLAKAPDERYQSGHGLRADLLTCVTQLRAHGKVAEFALGAHDSFETFQISQKLYGRDSARAVLLENFRHTAGGATRVVLVTGAPGAGKSVLVNELQKAILEANGHFVSGKFDQNRNDVPYAAIVHALRDLVGQILSRPDKELAAWRERLLSALGSRGQVLIDVIPALELITGPCPPVPKLPVEDDRNRFNLVFRDFTRALASPAHPLVLFLDDLQWVDAGSLSLLELLVTDISTRHLLVVGAYRDGEVLPQSRLLAAVDAMARAGISVDHIELPPLAVDDVHDLIRDTLRSDDAASRALAELVWKKTEGNPFFVNQFLQFLFDEGLLFFDRDQTRWNWELDRIESEGITDDVVDLMTMRISRLSEEGQRTLKLAAFLGNAFSIRAIATVAERSRAAVLHELRIARREGLLVAQADRAGVEDKSDAGDRGTFRFLHDRVQQAAYALTPQAQRAATHLRIGRLLQAAMSESELAVAPFEVVNNLNRGIELLSAPAERRVLAELNLRAARRAQGTTAYDAALGYLDTGLSLLGADCWDSEYTLAYDLHLRRLQVQFVIAAFGDADKTFAVLRDHVHDPIDRAYVAAQKMVIDTASERSDAAIALGLTALRELGIVLPAKPKPLHVIGELLKNRLLVGRRRPSDLAKLPPMSDKRLQAALQILKIMSVPAYIQNPNLMALVAARIVNISIRHGNAPASPQGYSLLGIIIGSFTGDYTAGYEFGSTAVALTKETDDVGVRCNALYTFAGYIHPWVRSESSSVTLLEESYQLAVDAGHIDYAVYAILTILFTQMSLGSPLDELRATIDRHQQFVDQSKNDFRVLLHLTRDWVDVLQARPGAAATAAAYAESSRALEVVRGDNGTRLSEFLIYKLQLAYHLGEWDTAASTADESAKYVDRVLGQIICAEHHFYAGLVAAAMIRRRPSERKKWQRVLAQSVKKFVKWTSTCAENFEDKKLLLDAELLALKNPDAALAKYDAAIAVAERNGFTHNVGTANELAARQSLALGRRTVAAVYFRAAAEAFTKWGALARVHKLAAEFPELNLVVRPESSTRVEDARWDATGTNDTLDLDSVLKTAQTISGERQLDRLLDRLLRLVLENAGAQRGCVVVRRDAALLIEASGSVDDAAVTVLQAEPAEASAELCYPIAQYVARTKGDLVLADARIDPRFRSDAYIVRNQTKSVLCFPVLKQGELIGLLYLENNLATGAFTPQRLQVLQLIASEVATAIENARLSEHLQQSAEALDIAKSKVDVLEKAKLELAKFVPASVQRAIDANPDAPQLEKRNADVSVLFLDLAGYTRMCERLGTDRAHDTVQRYFSSYLAHVLENGGEIAETAGDGLMILFQDPDPDINAANAARAALAIREKTRELNATAARDDEAVVVNIGINSGPVSLGATKFESAAGTRYTYTASGSTTNLAARVGAAATDGTILMTAETARRIRTRFSVTNQGARSLKNVAEPVGVYSLEEEQRA